jgi:CubicO group peptidase (beta-lactamase class C family)
MNHINMIPSDFSGCILITKADEIVYEGAFGYSDLPNKIPNTMTTRFATASAGKVFVAVGVLKLIEAGKLAFDSTIASLLDFDLRVIDPDITVEQLLTHTSGIPDYFDEQVMDDYGELWCDYPNYKIRKSSDLIPLFIDKPMMYPRGERFQYNNTGYVVLGLILEAITGVPFDQYLHQAVFLPCEMFDTGYYELDRLPERCANAYILDETSGAYYTNIYSVDVKGTGAGGAFTTVWDIHRFWKGIMNGTILSGIMVRSMLSPHAMDKDACYGYGIWLKKQADGSFVPYFEGSDPGVSFLSKRSVDGTVSTAVSNMGHNVWQIVA